MGIKNGRDIGQAIREKYIQQGYSRGQVAYYIGESIEDMADFEMGVHVLCISKLEKLAALLGCTICAKGILEK